MASPAAPRGVLFDFHQTLFGCSDVSTWAVSAGIRRDGVGLEQVLTALRQVWNLASAKYPGAPWDLDPGEHRRVFTEVITSHTDCTTVEVAALYDTMADHWAPLPGVTDLMTRLTTAQCKLAVISNIGLDIRPVLARYGLLAPFDAVVLSFEVGMVKPDPAIFQLTLDRIGCAAADSIMIGDSPTYDGGAATLGIPTLLVPPNDTSWIDTLRLVVATPAKPQ